MSSRFTRLGLRALTKRYRFQAPDPTPKRRGSSRKLPAPADRSVYPPDFSPDEIGIIEQVEFATMTSPERIVALIRAVQYLVENGIAGDFVECGVWRGGSMMAVARTLQRAGELRPLHLFDTFDGMPPPQAVDRNLRGQLAEKLLSQQDRSTSYVWALAQIDEVRKNMAATGYPTDQIHYVQGRIEATIPEAAPGQIALLRLDTDWYESTRHELEHLYPRLTAGGVLIVDDYGHWEGCRRAVDEYFGQMRPAPHLCRIDYTGRLAIKPANLRAA